MTSTDAFEKLSEHYQTLLDSGHLSDVVLVVGGKELHVHKLILSTHSPVFAAMFAHVSTKEAQENRVEIVDMDVEVVELLVRYIYTCKVGDLGQYGILTEYAADLLVAADKFQLDCLKSICKEQLMSQITTESVCDLLIFADLYQATELNTDDIALKCLGYIIYNATQVMHSNGWQKIVAGDDLMGKLFEHLWSKYSKIIDDSDQKMVELKNKEDIDCTLGADFDFEKYQLDDLKSVCEQRLLSQITVKSVSNLFILADAHQVTELTSKCVEYITDNVTEVMQQEDWKKVLVKAHLVAKLFEHLSKKYKKVLDDRLTVDIYYSYDYQFGYGYEVDDEFDF